MDGVAPATPEPSARCPQKNAERLDHKLGPAAGFARLDIEALPILKTVRS